MTKPLILKIKRTTKRQNLILTPLSIFKMFPKHQKTFFFFFFLKQQNAPLVQKSYQFMLY
ncbi:hypothetical protein AV921_0201400 [Helicobacter pylori]|nr:hypothetical protein AV921_0201400 [Helicobacter pylori]OJZ99753.1 hypothetical protein AV924_0201400 [Helicobacter pylori]